MTDRPINVYSEIGKLKTVMVHRPGDELINLMPDYLERLLFDDIPYLADAQKEHDGFTKQLRDLGINPVYIEDLATEAIDAAGVKEQYINDWIQESGVSSERVADALKDYLMGMDTKAMVMKSIAGFRKSEIQAKGQKHLVDYTESAYPFLVDPMPNLYFSRDNFASMAHGITLNHMYSDTRNRETLISQYIFDHHPVYGNGQVDRFYDRTENTRIEGGDELILGNNTIACGISQRTDARSIEKMAKRLFAGSEFNRILAFHIANNRKFMHLDTVFTMVDYDKFTIHPEIEGDLTVFDIQPGDGDEELKIVKREESLESILKEALNLDSVQLLRCGGGDPVDAAREQWNDGTNTLAVAPGEVVVYTANTITNALMKEHGILVHEIEGGQLVKGRGGPRCMTMPLYRENI